MTGAPGPELDLHPLGDLSDLVEPAPLDDQSDDPELTIAGDHGTRWRARDLRMISLGSLKSAARLKTADLSFLSAVFDGERAAFEPWLSLRLIDHERIASWAAYQRASPFEAEECEPDVAVRRVEWDVYRDVARFRAAPDKSAYLRGDTQVDSCIRFGRLAELPRLAAAVREGIEVMAGGVVVHAADRQDVIWRRLHLSVAAADTTMNLDYAPWMTRCGEAESWAHRWSELVDSLGDEAGLVPGSDVRVTYEDSFAELVARTHRFPRPPVERWLGSTERDLPSALFY